MMDQAKQKAQEVKSEATDMFRSQGDRGSTQAGEKVLSTAHDLRGVSDSLRDQGRDNAAKLVEEGAFQAERIANYLRTSDTDTILNDVQDYARRQPWVVALGGVALGVVAARMIKAAGGSPATSRTSRMSAESAHSRHLSAVPGTSTSAYEPGSHYETGSAHEPGSPYESGSEYEPGSPYEPGTLGGSSAEDLVDEEEDDYRTGEAGASGRPF
jgi:hypothetical protein